MSCYIVGIGEFTLVVSMNILIIDLVQKIKTLDTWRCDPIGGTTGSMIILADALTYKGCNVVISTKTGDGSCQRGIRHESIDKYKLLINETDIVIFSSRMNTSMLQYAHSKHKRIMYVTGDLPSVERTYWLDDSTWVDMVDEFIFVSKFHKDTMVSYYNHTLSSSNCHFIYRPVDVGFGNSRFSNVVSNKLVYAGAPCKCILMLPKVLRNIPGVGDKTKWVCDVYSSNDLYNDLGDLPGDKYDSIYRVAFNNLRRLNNVIVHDIVNKSELSVVFNRSNIFIHTQDYEETCGTTMLESMMAGVVPVSVGKGSSPELITHNINGILVDDTSNKFDVMADEIDGLLKDKSKLEFLSKNAASSIYNNLRPETIAEQYMKLF